MLSWFKRIPVRQIPELDSIRFLSILLVVLHHQFFEDNALLRWFKDHGWVGVDIFFGMSGFLITGLLMKELDRTKTVDLLGFWYRRMLRLWPSWFFTLALSFLMVFFLSRSNPELRETLFSKWWHYPLHFGNYSYTIAGKLHTLYSHFWSLAVEEHFYVLWPLLLFFVRSRRGLVLAMLGLIVASTLFRYYHITQGHSLQVVSFSTHTRIDELLMGCLLALYWDRIPNLSPLVEFVLTVSSGLLFYLGLYVCKENSASAVLASLTYTLIGIGTCLLIVVALKGGRRGIRRAFQVPFTARLGVLSYGVYLIHLHVNYVVFPALKLAPWFKDETTVALINLILPFVPAYFMYFYLDEYFAKFKHGHRAQVPAPELVPAIDPQKET